jgi:predicted GIY-YIG superfamily endonuclease
VYFVYVLQNQESGLRYVGQTDDLQRRIARHNQPDPAGVRFTGTHWDMGASLFRKLCHTSGSNATGAIAKERDWPAVAEGSLAQVVCFHERLND